jgi:hypothetical protein
MGMSTRYGAASLAVAAVCVTTLGLATAPGAHAGTSGARPARLPGCSESGSVRPARYNPICNDGSYTVIQLHWSTWSGTAAGKGEFYERAGRYPVSVSAWRVRGGIYTRFSYTFSAAVPDGFPRSWTISYSSGAWHGRVV